MSACADLRVLFRAAAGPRRGYGHLVRCRSLARALGVRPLLSLRAPRTAIHTALQLGCDVVVDGAHRLVRGRYIDLLVVDDPIARAAARWITAARRAGVAVVSVHDLGLGSGGADLRIDGSIVQGRTTSHSRAVVGPAFAILDPALTRHARVKRRRNGVVVSLGGGPRAAVASAIAVDIARRAPHVEVRVTGGFNSSAPPASVKRRRLRNLVWLGPTTNLAGELGRASVAVVGGGVTLYEACALATPAVGVPVVKSQRPTVTGFVARGAALGTPRVPPHPERVADDVLRLLGDASLRNRIGRTASRLIDGRGALRAARAISRLVEER